MAALNSNLLLSNRIDVHRLVKFLGPVITVCGAMNSVEPHFVYSCMDSILVAIFMNKPYVCWYLIGFVMVLSKSQLKLFLWIVSTFCREVQITVFSTNLLCARSKINISVGTVVSFDYTALQV